LIHNIVSWEKQAQKTNWKQQFQKPQNENICLTNLNVENNGNFPILSLWKRIDNKHQNTINLK